MKTMSPIYARQHYLVTKYGCVGGAPAVLLLPAPRVAGYREIHQVDVEVAADRVSSGAEFPVRVTPLTVAVPPIV